MNQVPAPDREQLRARYPQVFDRPASARLVTPTVALAAFAIFIFGLVDLDFSPTKFLNGLHQLGWISLLMLPPDPGSSLPLYLKSLGETLSIALPARCCCRVWRRSTVARPNCTASLTRK